MGMIAKRAVERSLTISEIFETAAVTDRELALLRTRFLEAYEGESAEACEAAWFAAGGPGGVTVAEMDASPVPEELVAASADRVVAAMRRERGTVLSRADAARLEAEIAHELAYLLQRRVEQVPAAATVAGAG